MWNVCTTGERGISPVSVECLYNWGDRYLYCFLFSGILWFSIWFIWRDDAGLRQWGCTDNT